MKALYTSLFALLATALTYGQCTPNTSLTTPGIYPPAGGSVRNDTIYVMPVASLGAAYDETVQLVVPADSTVDLGGGVVVTADVDSMRVVGMNNVPAWLSYSCDNAGCSWPGGTNGCFSFTGTAPTTNNVWLMEAEVEVAASLGAFGQVIDTVLLYVEVTSGTIGLAEYAQAEPVVSPNPAKDHFDIRFETSVSSDWKLEILDITGRTVLAKNGRTVSGDNRITVQRNNWPEGVYLYRMTIGDRVSTGRVILSNGL